MLKERKDERKWDPGRLYVLKSREGMYAPIDRS